MKAKGNIRQKASEKWSEQGRKERGRNNKNWKKGRDGGVKVNWEVPKRDLGRGKDRLHLSLEGENIQRKKKDKHRKEAARKGEEGGSGREVRG